MDGGPVPEGMTTAADHMEGMDGAPATVVGAYDTYTYSVNYTPTTGGDPVEDHMNGMDGAEATIASSTEETVYVVDYETDGMTMTNHKWVIESEMQPAS